MSVARDRLDFSVNLTLTPTELQKLEASIMKHEAFNMKLEANNMRRACSKIIDQVTKLFRRGIGTEKPKQLLEQIISLRLRNYITKLKFLKIIPNASMPATLILFLIVTAAYRRRTSINLSADSRFSLTGYTTNFT